MKLCTIATRVLAPMIVVLGLVSCGGGDTSGAGTSGLSLTPRSIKTLHFAWVDASSETGYRLLESPDGVTAHTLVATLPANTTSHDLVVFLPARLNASYILQTCTGATCTDSAPVFVSGNLAAAIGYLKASNTGYGDQAGYSVALAADGGTLAVGAPYEDSSATGIDGTGSDSSADSGAVYVYTQSAGVWSQQAYVKASNTGSADRFGWSVALSADGSTLAVGAPYEDSSATGIGGNQADNAGADSGAVYVYTRSAGLWTQQAYVKASNTGSADRYGWSVALAADGSTLAVGAPFEDSSDTGIGGNQADNAGADSGAAYVYVRSVAGNWSQQAYVKASNTGFNDQFGHSLALAADGNTLAVGAPLEDSSATGIDGTGSDSSADSGAAYVYVRSGAVWSPQAYVKASNTGFYDQFGHSVALAADGNTLAVGAPFEDSSATNIGGNQADDYAGADSGAAYVYTRTTGVWSQQAYVKASNTGYNDQFGQSVALGAVGNTLAVGAPLEDSSAIGLDGSQVDESGSNSGAAYLYTRSAGVWTRLAYVKAPNTGFYDQFGHSLALAADGGTLAAGAWGEDSAATGIGGNQADNTVVDSGAVYLY